MTSSSLPRRRKGRRSYVVSAYSTRSPFSSSKPLHPPTPLAVIEHAAGIVRRNYVTADGANGPANGLNLLVAELLRDQPDLSPMLDVDHARRR